MKTPLLGWLIWPGCEFGRKYIVDSNDPIFSQQADLLLTGLSVVDRTYM
jgi:hypothetical protein